MSVQNAAALLAMYSHKNVAAVRTPSGIRIMGTRNLSEGQKKSLIKIPQHELEAALRWQK